LTLLAEFTALPFNDRNKRKKESSVSNMADETSGRETNELGNSINIQRKSS
jgi:hypothetical protein